MDIAGAGTWIVIACATVESDLVAGPTLRAADRVIDCVEIAMPC